MAAATVQHKKVFMQKSEIPESFCHLIAAALSSNNVCLFLGKKATLIRKWANNSS